LCAQLTRDLFAIPELLFRFAAVRLSVRLSVTRWYWLKTNNRRIMLF